jgi:hypothetical protein
VKDGPTEKGSVFCSGVISYSCCGMTWRSEGPRQYRVKCPDCGKVFKLTLSIALSSNIQEKEDINVYYRIKNDVDVTLGQSKIKLLKGAVYPTSYDPWGVIPRIDGEVLLEVKGVVKESMETSYVVSVPREDLERLDESKAGTSKDS